MIGWVGHNFKTLLEKKGRKGRPGSPDRLMIPLKRWQEPENLAAMAVFLASPRARQITGQTINVDGGYVMHW